MKYICQYCGKEFTNNGGLKAHEKFCKLNPDREKNLSKRKQYTHHIINDEEITCKFCGKKFKSKSNKTQHELICKLNPNRIARTIRQKYDMMSNNDLLNEIKKYTSISNVPHQLISVCKERKIWDFKKFFGMKKYTDKELLNQVEIYSKKNEIPYLLRKELKERKIDLPSKFNPKGIKGLDNKSLLLSVENIKDVYEAKEKGLIENIRELKRRNILPERFKGNLCISKFRYDTTEDLLKIVNNYKIKESLYKDGNGKALEELIRRNVENLPEYTKKSRNSQWHNYNTEELIKLINGINSRKELKEKKLLSVVAELKRRNINLKKYIGFTRVSRPEYKNMSDNELINIGKEKFFNKCISEACKIDRPLINQLRLRDRDILYKVFPEARTAILYNADYFIEQFKNKFTDTHPCGKKYDLSKVYKTYKKWKSPVVIGCPIHGYFEKSCNLILQNINYGGCPICNGNDSNLQYKKYKLNLLTQYDLLSMDWAVILDLIGIDKLPNEFNCLTKFGANTPGRKKMIEDLIKTYNIEVPDNEGSNLESENTDEESIEKEVDDIENEETIYEESDKSDKENELTPYKENKNIGSLSSKEDEKIFSTGDKWLHIIHKQMNKLWNLILRDNENHSTKNIEIIKSKLNGDITKFERYVYGEFLKEYNEVINLEIH